MDAMSPPPAVNMPCTCSLTSFTPAVRSLRALVAGGSVAAFLAFCWINKRQLVEVLRRCMTTLSSSPDAGRVHDGRESASSSTSTFIASRHSSFSPSSSSSSSSSSLSTYAQYIPSELDLQHNCALVDGDMESRVERAASGVVAGKCVSICVNSLITAIAGADIVEMNDPSRTFLRHILSNAREVYIIYQNEVDTLDNKVKDFLTDCFQPHGLIPHKILVCSTVDGRGVIVRSLSTHVHLDHDPHVLAAVQRYMPNTQPILLTYPPGRGDKELRSGENG